VTENGTQGKGGGPVTQKKGERTINQGTTKKKNNTPQEGKRRGESIRGLLPGLSSRTGLCPRGGEKAREKKKKKKPFRGGGEIRSLNPKEKVE